MMEEAVISFDDDDEMADLFSFGAPPDGSSSPRKKSEQEEFSKAMASVMPVPVSQEVEEDEESAKSEDSFLELLEQQKEAVTVLDPSSATREKTEKESNDAGEKNMQEILDWLDEDDDKAQQMKEEKEGEVLVAPQPKTPTLTESVPTLTIPPPEFDTLEQAVKSPKATMKQIRNLLEKERFYVSAEVRPHLWCRVVCGKTLEETIQSSVADSFQQWEKGFQQEQEQSSEGDKEAQPDTEQTEWIVKQSAILANRIVTVRKDDPKLSQQALSIILINHYHTGRKATKSKESETSEDGSQQYPDYKDPLLPPVVCTLLSAGVPKVAGAVMLSHIVPHFMPILGLTMAERSKAALTMHQQMYLLSRYHLPLLVMHLDRYLPDWYQWPTTGFVPQSYLISHLAGEYVATDDDSNEQAMMNPRSILSLWDLILTSSNNSLRFFLVLAILETHAARLLLLTGDPLRDEVKAIMRFQQEGSTADGSAIEEEEGSTAEQATQWVREWTDKAQALWEHTPVSVSRQLRKMEDEAVTGALMKRQKEAEERLKRKLEAEARAHQEAMEAERERKADEARLRLTRVRLVAFYRQYNPGKETNIDKIMKAYEGRYDVLDNKLRKKYGIGFNPATKPKPATNKRPIATKNIRPKQQEEQVVPQNLMHMVVKATPDEVLPVVCRNKESHGANMSKLKKGSKLEESTEGRVPMKFCLVDSRPEDAAVEQGRFPSAESLSPECFMDPDRLQEKETVFESLRGSVHICIMGSGFAALPELYGHKMTKGLSEFIKQDELRNSNVALYFLKKGFPFVSVLDGGFAGAHAFLCRQGPGHQLNVNLAIADYNPDVSLFAQFERAHNGKEAGQRSIQNFFDSSMAALTMKTMRFESLAAEVGNVADDRQPKPGGNMVARFFGGNDEANNQGRARGGDATAEPNAAPVFRNPFARNNQGPQNPRQKPERQVSKESMGSSMASLEVESIDDLESEGNESSGEAAGGAKERTRPAQVAKGPSVPPKQGGEPDAGVQRGNRAKPNPAVAKRTTDQGKANPFSGLGAAFNKKAPTAPQEQPKGSSNPRPRNPFARFGMNNANQQPKKADNPLVGFNPFRKNTMARTRNAPGQVTEQNSLPDEKVEEGSEELVALDQSSSAIASSNAGVKPNPELSNQSALDAGDGSASLEAGAGGAAPAATKPADSPEEEGTGGTEESNPEAPATDEKTATIAKV